MNENKHESRWRGKVVKFISDFYFMGLRSPSVFDALTVDSELECKCRNKILTIEGLPSEWENILKGVLGDFAPDKIPEGADVTVLRYVSKCEQEKVKTVLAHFLPLKEADEVYSALYKHEIDRQVLQTMLNASLSSYRSDVCTS